MRWLTCWLRRLRTLFKSEELDQQLDSELEYYIDQRRQAGLAAGLPADEARAAALRSLGGLSQVREACRDQRGVRGLQDLGQDLRQAMRSIVSNLGMSMMHVALIAISICLACTAFIVVDIVLLRSLPAITEPERLVLISGVGNRDDRLGQPLNIFERLAELREGTTHIFAYRNYGGLPATVGTTTIPLRGVGVVGNYFDGIGGIPLLMGRTFNPESDEPVAIIGSWVWQERFGGASDVLDKTITLGSLTFSVVGVASPEFLGMQPDLRWDLIAPFNVLSRARGLSQAAIRSQLIYPVARLSPSVTAAEYEARIAAAWPAILESTVPSGRTLDEWRRQRGARVAVDSLRKGQAFTLLTTPGLPRVLVLTAGLAVLIFLASCVTLGLLVVARAARQQHNTAIRIALGGTWWRVIRPQVFEASMISLLGCGVGLLMTVWATDATRTFLPGDWPVGLTPSSIVLAGSMAVATTVIAAGFAAYLSMRGSARDVLQSVNRASRPHANIRAALLVAQFAVSVMLVHSTLFYVDDVAKLARTEIGLDPTDLHVYTLAGRLPERGLGNDYFRELVAALRAVPGAEAVALSGTAPPLSFIRDLTEPVQRSDGAEMQASVVCVFPGVFEAWKAPRVAGRDLEWNDGPTAVVTNSLARKLEGQGSPLGQRIRPNRPSGPKARELEIVGVVGDMAYNGPRLGYRDVVFISCLERTNPWPSSYGVQIFIRSRRSLGDLEADIRHIVDRAGVHYLYSMDDQHAYVASSMEREQVLATLSSAFGGFILALTGLGLFAFCSYMQVCRNRELAIRGALGARPHNIAATLLRETVVVLTVGVAIGLSMVFLVTRVLPEGMIDPGSLTVPSLFRSAAILIGVAAAASLLPTTRALRINLARSLRVD